MKSREYLSLCGEIAGLSRRETKSRSDELLSLVGLDGVKKRIGGFSRGMKQRLGIAQALLARPKLLICDEPTSALDPVGRKEVLDILRKIKGSTTVLFSTHILSDVEWICDRLAVLHNGGIAVCGTLSEIRTLHRRDSLLLEFFSDNDVRKFKSCVNIVPLLEISFFHFRYAESSRRKIYAGDYRVVCARYANHTCRTYRFGFLDTIL